MIKYPDSLHPWVLVGLAGALGVALLIGHRASSRIPEVGPLDPVLAAPAERLEMVHLQPGSNLRRGASRARISGGRIRTPSSWRFASRRTPGGCRTGPRSPSGGFRERDGLRGVDVALNRDETVRLLRDGAGWSSDMVHTPIWVDTVFVSGRSCRTSSGRCHPRSTRLSPTCPTPDRAWVVDWMDKVFQWQVDFSRQVRAGDTYRFALEREVRPDGTMRAGHLIAAEYVNQGTPYRAIWFDPNDDGDGTYYDEDGKSVRRAFLHEAHPPEPNLLRLFQRPAAPDPEHGAGPPGSGFRGSDRDPHPGHQRRRGDLCRLEGRPGRIWWRSGRPTVG